MYYILKNKQPVLVTDIQEWAKMFEVEDIIVKQTMLGEVKVSTVFLGLDHSYGKSGRPVVFETMIFDLESLQGYQERYSTWEEAEQGHEIACELVKEAQRTRWEKFINWLENII